MRTRINLSTQPYEDAREYLVRWGSLLALLAVVSIALLAFTVHAVRQSSDTNRQLAQMNRNIATLDSEKATAEKMLALPQNKGTVEKSQYLNKIFARKAFSWTTVFSDMEKLMPPGLRVLSITPALDDQNQLQVHILVGGESRERAIELIRNLEKTPSFRDVALRSDVMDLNSVSGGSSTSTEHDPVRFDIVAQYVPATQGARPRGSEEASAESKSGTEPGNGGGR